MVVVEVEVAAFSSPAAALIDHEFQCAPSRRLGPACGPDFNAELFGALKSLKLRGAGCESLEEQDDTNDDTEGAAAAERILSFSIG